MSRLIDAEKYRKEFLDSRDFEPMKILDFQPTVQAIPLDNVKKAREEFISKYPKNYMGEPELGGRTCYFSLNEVLTILDELIESEE